MVEDVKKSVFYILCYIKEKNHFFAKKYVDKENPLWYIILTSLCRAFFTCIKNGEILTQEAQIMRVKITLACTECKQRNYNTIKNKKNNPDRLEMNKYCPFCRKHTVHKESK